MEAPMTVRVGINGFGRIGRSYLRAVLDRAVDPSTAPIDVVAINDVTDTGTLAHLLKYDSTYGPLGWRVDYDDSQIAVDDRIVEVYSYRDPVQLPWEELGVDVVIESTGRFRAREDAAAHLKAGARKVLISAPGKNIDRTIVMGVNEGEYDPAADDVISNASLHDELRRADGQGAP